MKDLLLKQKSEDEVVCSRNKGYSTGLKQGLCQINEQFGGDILRKSTPLSKDNLIKMNIPQGEDTSFKSFL